MNETVEQLDAVLIARWSDAVAFREALVDFESRLAERLESAAEALRLWLAEQGYPVITVDTKWANIDIARESWVSKKSKKPRVCITVGALFPFGYRKVQEDHPFLWLMSWGLDRENRAAFRDHLVSRVSRRPGDWINEDCDRESPAGRYIKTHGDLERLRMAQAPERIVAFVKSALPPILELGDDVDEALRQVGK